MPMSFAICHLSLKTCNYMLPLQLRANPNPRRGWNSNQNHWRGAAPGVPNRNPRQGVAAICCPV
jgi:hypothetical protein